MLVLNDAFKEKIINRYQKDGIIWLNNLDTIVNKYKNMFKLTNIRILDNLSINVVICADSSDYGSIIMKIGAPGITSLNEIKYINLLPLDNMVRCYYYNTDDSVMILENIHPLDVLLNELNIKHQLIRPRTPRHNGKVERSHRNDQNRFYNYLKFYSYDDLLKQMKSYLNRSNNIPM